MYRYAVAAAGRRAAREDAKDLFSYAAATKLDAPSGLANVVVAGAIRPSTPPVERASGRAASIARFAGLFTPLPTGVSQEARLAIGGDAEEERDLRGEAPRYRVRLFAAYTQRGMLIPYDGTAVLWLWYKDEPAAPREVVASVSNLAFQPLVQSQPGTDSVGLAVTHGGRVWTRSGAGGVATSDDYGSSWTDTRHAFTHRARSLDGESVIVASAKPAVALSEPTVFPRLSFEEMRPTRRARALVAAMEEEEWGLQPLPAALRCAVLHDVCVLEA